MDNVETESTKSGESEEADLYGSSDLDTVKLKERNLEIFRQTIQVQTLQIFTFCPLVVCLTATLCFFMCVVFYFEMLTTVTGFFRVMDELFKPIKAWRTIWTSPKSIKGLAGKGPLAEIVSFIL